MSTQDDNDTELDEFGFGLDLPVSALANDQVVYASPDVTICEAAKIMNDEGIGLLVLQAGAKTVGVVSERDVLRAVATAAPLDDPVAAIANGQTVLRAAPTSTVGDVAQEMMENYVRHVLISGPDGQAQSVVSVRDLLAVIAN